MESILKALEQNNTVQAPRCIFVPDKAIMNKMMKALLKYGTKDSKEIFLLRFGLF